MEAKNTTRLGRRALLAAAVGGVAAVAGAIAAPGRVMGADGDPIVIGQANTGTVPTQLAYTGTIFALAVTSSQGIGVAAATGAASNQQGVVGVANFTGCQGVRGRNNATGSRGDLGTGTAGVEAIQGNAPLALNVFGKAHFTRSGVATIESGKRFVQIDMDGLTNSSLAVATLLQLRDNLYVQSITVSASSASIYIYVNRYAPSNTRVGWIVFD